MEMVMRSLASSSTRDEYEEGDEIYLSHDLIIEILVRIPPKSLVKLIFLSRFWSSIIRGKYFTRSYLSRSSNRPCFLLTFFSRNYTSDRIFHSSSQEKPFCSDYRRETLISVDPWYTISPPIRGLICLQYLSNFVICNPSTCQLVTLPKVETSRINISSFFGYDPINDQYKVLCMTVAKKTGFSEPVVSEEHQVFTVSVEKSWRKIECQVQHCPATEGLCKNGVLYYGALSNDRKETLLVCFDVRLEDFSVVKLPNNVQIRYRRPFDLFNYQGKLGLMNHSLESCADLWVLEDAKEQKWSILCIVGDPLMRFCCRGTIESTGALVFEPDDYVSTEKSISVYYVDDVKKRYWRRVEILRLEDPADKITIFLDHVESCMFL